MKSVQWGSQLSPSYVRSKMKKPKSKSASCIKRIQKRPEKELRISNERFGRPALFGELRSHSSIVERFSVIDQCRQWIAKNQDLTEVIGGFSWIHETMVVALSSYPLSEEHYGCEG